MKMAKYILIPDSFKGTMSSLEICNIMEKEILKRESGAKIVKVPVADGGEGSVDAFLEACGGEKVFVEVTGPYSGEKVKGYFGILPDNTAVLEMAAAAALPMVGDRKDPSRTTTYGVGELMVAAAKRGVKKLILGLGGSATNDAACGLAAACGITFRDEEGKSFIPVGDTLDKVVAIDTSTMEPCLKDLTIVTMCDIDNPFYGPEGAPAIYGPQKGADEAMVKSLDEKMRAFSKVIIKDLGVDVQKIPGSGAAGGMGGGMAAYFGSQLQMGIETVLDTVRFDALLEDTDFVFTGEGKIDGQSLRGKVVIGVARKAKAKKVKVVAFVGDIGDNVEGAYEEGVTAIMSINRVAVPYKEARIRAESDLALTVDNFLRLTEALR